jgi:hypothetical protein
VREVLSYRLIRQSLGSFGVACLVWPWLTGAALMLFQWSMRRARVKPVHVWRCVVYCADVLVATAVVYIYMIAERELNHWGGAWPVRWSPSALFDSVWPWVAVALLGLVSYRLIVAYRLYLRFNHVIATVVASQVIVALAVWKLLLVLQGF